MQQPIFISLIQNIALLLSFTLIYDYSWIKNEKPITWFHKIIIGLLIGAISIIIMMTPWEFASGIVFDTRSVLLAISGLFFGFIPTTIAMLTAGIYRFVLGGDGIWMGIAVIFSSGTIGILWQYFRPNWQNSRFKHWELLSLGFLVHLTMLVCTLLLPSEKFLTTLKTIALPLIVIYTPGTMFLGLLMLRQLKNWQNRKALNQLTELERRFKEILENINLISVMFDRKGNITFVNRHFLESTGYTQIEVIGINWFEQFIPKANKERMQKIFQKYLIQPNEMLNYENEILTKTGEKLQISWYNSILKDENGKVIGWASIGENTTTRKLKEQELIDAKNKAEESDQLKSVFLANMSHEIRTPLNAIMGFSNIIAKNSESDIKTLQYAEIINRASHRLLQIINDIIDVSKIEAHQMKFNFSTNSISETILAAIDTIEKSEVYANKNSLKIEVDIKEEFEELIIKLDHNRIKQVYENLLHNSVKFTNQGHIKIGYQIIEDENQQWFEGFVKDEGKGIPKDKYELIFQRFRQIEENTFHEGIGLGLNICKGIVELLGGTIRFESELNKGTTFYFKIPCIDCQIKQKIHKKTDSLEQSLSNITILIAEDDFSSYMYLKELFSKYPIEILYADNGLKVMEILKDITPQLILLDINMPYKSGIECLQEIKELGIESKIIIQTAYTLTDERERCMALGCHGFIAKPVTKKELFLTVQTVLNN